MAPARKTAKKAASPAKSASAAERKAAVEQLAEEAGLDDAIRQPGVSTAPATPPREVKHVSPAERKAVVEQLAQDTGVAGALSKAPWKRKSAAPSLPVDQPPPKPPAEGEEIVDRQSPKRIMTEAPIARHGERGLPRFVILDTNALMMQFQFHVDIEREVRRILDFDYEIVVPQIVIDELEGLMNGASGKAAGEARMALELAKTFKVEESPGDGDTGILRLAERLNALVVTNDKRLRARLRAMDLPSIYMRSRAFLTVDGHIPGL